MQLTACSIPYTWCLCSTLVSAFAGLGGVSGLLPTAVFEVPSWLTACALNSCGLDAAQVHNQALTLAHYEKAEQLNAEVRLLAIR